jgi:hypothetical protein
VQRAPAVERIEIPPSHYAFACRRMKEFVRFAGNLAGLGTLDLENLAASAYLQGVFDGYEVSERRRETPAIVRTRELYEDFGDWP